MDVAKGHGLDDSQGVVRTDDGSLTLRHAEHGECYHSTLGARTEARLLYIERSGFLPALSTNAATPLRILDVGLGLGYNALATINAWLACDAPRSLQLVSLENDDALVRAFTSGDAPWQCEWTDAERAIVRTLREVAAQQWIAQLTHPKNDASIAWTIAVGDAMTTLPAQASRFDFIWQDPFSPERNPPLWGAPWFALTHNAAAPGCTLATYSVARTVKDALSAGGWSWRRIDTGVPRKRHWLLATPTVAATAIIPATPATPTAPR